MKKAMIPKFKEYFAPFLFILRKKGDCRLYDLARYIAEYLKLSPDDLSVKTNGGKITKHSSRVNYCASYLKKMRYVENYSKGVYRISQKGLDLLDELGCDFTLDELRDRPEYVFTQIGKDKSDLVYVKSHFRGGKKISPYICKRTQLKECNPNIVEDFKDDDHNDG